MAKRFTSTDKWVDPWFCSLSDRNKLFWFYILDNCNHAGIWQVNWPLVKFHIKNFVFNSEVFTDRIFELSIDKYYIPKFIEFQYGSLNPENRLHKSVIDILEKEGASKVLISPLEGRTAQYKDKDKDKDKERDGVKGKGFVPPTIEEVRNYCFERGNKIDPQQFIDKNASIGWVVGKNRSPMKDWKAVIRTWESYDNKPVEMLTETQKRNVARFKDWEKRQEIENAEANV